MTKDQALLFAVMKAIDDAYQEHVCPPVGREGSCGLCLLGNRLLENKREVEEMAARGRYDDGTAAAGGG